MKRRFGILLLFALGLFFQGCASVDKGAELERARVALEERTKRDNDIYHRYEELNTLEGFREFVQKYPDNLNLGNARMNIEKLAYEECDDPACLKVFIAEFPGSSKAGDARARLNLLAVNDLDQELKGRYGFDLLLYRLNLKRLRKELIDSGKAKLSDFEESFSMVEFEKKSFFLTRLTFGYDLSVQDIASPKVIGEVFDSILSPQLDYLSVKFKKKQMIGGFGFDILMPASKTASLRFYFPMDQVDLFIQGGLQKEALIQNALYTAPSAVAPAYTETQPAPDELRSTSVNDGLANTGKFIRTADPAFTFEYPGNWDLDDLDQGAVFSATNKQTGQNCRVSIFRVGEVAASKADLSGAEEAVKREKAHIERNLPSRDVIIDYVRPTNAFGEYPAFESEVRWKSIKRLSNDRRSIADFGTMRELRDMTSRLYWILTRSHAMLLSVTFRTGPGGRLGPLEVRSIYNTLVFSSNTTPPKPKESGTQWSQPLPDSAVTVNSATIREEMNPKPKALQYMPVSSPKDGSANTGRFVRSAPPAFAFSYPAGWNVQSRHDAFILEQPQGALHSSVRIMTASITGDTTAYLDSFAAAYAESLRVTGISIELLYSIFTQAYEGHEACEFEIRCKPRGGKPSSAWTVYGNVIAKDGYAIILIGETADEIDPLKDMFEKIDWKK